jgi:hypothetical protein
MAAQASTKKTEQILSERELGLQFVGGDPQLIANSCFRSLKNFAII